MEQPVRTPPVKYGEAMALCTEILISIFVPTALCALGGRWLDANWHTSPWMTVVGLLLALVITTVLVVHKARQFKL